MADFKKVLQIAHDGYTKRSDYPSFALVPWDDRAIWTKYLEKINDELNDEEKPPRFLEVHGE